MAGVAKHLKGFPWRYGVGRAGSTAVKRSLFQACTVSFFVELTTDSEHEHEHEHEYFRVHERGRHIGSCIFWRSGGQCSVFTLSANAYCGQWSEVSFVLKLTVD